MQCEKFGIHPCAKAMNLQMKRISETTCECECFIVLLLVQCCPGGVHQLQKTLVKGENTVSMSSLDKDKQRFWWDNEVAIEHKDLHTMHSSNATETQHKQKVL